MKITHKTDKGFEPFVINITIETEIELEIFEESILEIEAALNLPNWLKEIQDIINTRRPKKYR